LDADTKKTKFIKHTEVPVPCGCGDDESVITGYKQKLVTCESFKEGSDRTSCHVLCRPLFHIHLDRERDAFILQLFLLTAHGILRRRQYNSLHIWICHFWLF